MAKSFAEVKGLCRHCRREYSRRVRSRTLTVGNAHLHCTKIVRNPPNVRLGNEGICELWKTGCSMMLYFETFCSMPTLATFLQILNVASAANIGHLARSVHQTNARDAAQTEKRSLTPERTKRASSEIRPTLLIVERINAT